MTATNLSAETLDPDLGGSFLARTGAALVRAPAAPSGLSVSHVPSNPLISAMHAALCAAGPHARTRVGGWLANGELTPVFKWGARAGGSITVYPDMDAALEGEAAPPNVEALWSFVEDLNPLTADVAFAVLAELCAPGENRGTESALIQSTEISVDQLLHRLGGVNRANRKALTRAIAAEMARLRVLAFAVEGYPVFDSATRQWHPTGVSWSGDRLFDVVEIRGKGRDDVRWIVRAGQWAYWWLNREGRYWVGELSTALVETKGRNGQAEAIEKKLGRRLTLLSIALRHPPVIVRRIDRLLADVGELPLPEYRTGHWAGRTRDRVERALSSLESNGVLKSVTWPDGHGSSDLRVGRWVEEWLSARVRIEMLGRQAAGGLSNRPNRSRPKHSPSSSQFDHR